MSTTALYPGSFDPPTLGHVDIARRGAAMFAEVIVAVGHNPAKRPWLDLDTRVALVREACAGLANVRVVSFSGLLVTACRDHGADVILRGLRAASDFDSEFRYGLANRDLSGVETVFLPADPRHVFLSSSIVREIVGGGGDVSAYVPPCVLRVIAGRSA